MVCDEIKWDIGSENHAATLLSFGCCRGAPLLKADDTGREQELAEDFIGGMRRALPSARHLTAHGNEVREENYGSMRRLQAIEGRVKHVHTNAGGLLEDEHSLAANYAELIKQESALKKRVSKLKPKDMLPFRSAGVGRFVLMFDPCSFS